MARQRDEPEKVRQRLLETAAEHFARHGLAGANVDAIAIGAGYAKGTLYNYFASKEALFGAVIEAAAQVAAERYRDIPPAPSTRERLLGLARVDVSVMREQEAFTQVLVREALGFRPATYPLVLQHLAPYLGAVREVLEAGVAAGEVRSDRPTEELAVMFVGLLGLMYVQYWGSEGAWPALDEMPEQAVSLFLDGAAPRAPR